MKRRDFLKLSANLGALAFIQLAGISCSKGSKSVSLPRLPYPENALEPYISAQTIGFHYGKHHQGYVNKVNKAVSGTRYAKMPLEEIIKAAAGKPGESGIFNNAAQVYNHTFYWNSMKPGGGGAPAGKAAEKINAAFGSYEKFADAFTAAATGQFGSGWAWLVLEDETLKIIKTSNADTPIAHGMTPVLTLDVWEHAYYLDYQNRRADYVKTWLAHLINWEFAALNMGCKEKSKIEAPKESH